MPKPNKGGGDSGGNTIRGSRRDDTLISTSADDIVKAGSGTDTLVIDGSVWDYDWSWTSEKGVDWKLTDTSGQTGVDKLSNVEILQFNDATIVLGEDIPMEIFDAPTTFEVMEDETTEFSFIVRDIDDNDAEVRFESGFNYLDTAFGRMRVGTNMESFDNGLYLWGPQSTQRVFDFEFSYNETGASLAEGEIRIETVTLFVTTTSSEDFFGYTAKETREVTFDVQITGVNDAPTIAGYAAFEMTNAGSNTFELSALGNDIDSDDDGTTLTYDIVSVSQIYGDHRYPFDIATDGNQLLVSPDGLPVGLATDEESWAEVELQTIDRHGAVSENTIVVDITMAGTATGSLRSSVLDMNGDVDLSSVTFGPDDIVDYGTETLFSATNPLPEYVAPMLEYSLGDDARHITAGSLSGFTFETDETAESRLGLGADTLVFNLTSPTQQFFALNQIDTGWGEDVVVLDMTGGNEMRYYGTSIDTGAQSDQVIVRADATTGAWFNPEISTGSGHDVVDLQFSHLGGPAELVSDAQINLGSGNDTLNFVLNSDPSIDLATAITLEISAGDGNDFIHIDTSDISAIDYRNADGTSTTASDFYPGGTVGDIYLGNGDDTLVLDLNSPPSGNTALSVYGDGHFDNGGFDNVTLQNIVSTDVTSSNTTDAFGKQGTALDLGNGQIINLFDVDELIFADDVNWAL